jgi:predicted  nucleic acid-binding Zn-ribbon protein
MKDLSHVHHQLRHFEPLLVNAQNAVNALKPSLEAAQSSVSALQSAVEASPVDQAAKDALIAKQEEVASLQHQINLVGAMIPDYTRKITSLNAELAAAQD